MMPDPSSHRLLSRHFCSLFYQFSSRLGLGRLGMPPYPVSHSNSFTSKYHKYTKTFFTEATFLSFDQSNPGHFISQNHNSQNQMVYPQMQADVRSRSTFNSVEWLINAHVSGFELDLDPNIATFVFSLLD